MQSLQSRKFFMRIILVIQTSLTCLLGVTGVMGAVIKKPAQQVKEGRELAIRLLSMTPKEELDGKAMLKRRDSKGKFH